MKDLEQMKNTFNELGVEFTENTAKDEYNENIKTTYHDGEAKWDVSLNLENGIGYCGFFCVFYFLDGKYLNHGCWE